MPVMSKLTSAYVAGIIDGEGYLGIQKQHRSTYQDGIKYEACIKIGMTNKDLIVWFKNSFGGNIHHRKFKDNCKDAYTWTIRCNKRIIPFLDKVIPYLRIKKRQAEILRKFFKTYYDGNKDGHTLKGNVKLERENLYKQIRVLNQRGISAP